MHFVGVLFGGNESLLEQYWEELEVEPYIAYTKEEIISEYINRRKQGIEWRKKAIKENPENSSSYQEWINTHPKFTKKQAWKEIKEDYEGRIDDDGNILSTYNPDAQWDWYVVGGRWDGYFPLKTKDEDGNPERANEATIDEIDWDLYVKEFGSPYCYITEVGDWVNKGDLGWFSSTNETDTEEWDSEFLKLVKSKDGDLVLKAIDFHM